MVHCVIAHPIVQFSMAVLLLLVRTECNRVTYKYGTPRPQSTTFYSPNFPQAYPANVACILYWFIGDANHIVQLRFLEFDIQTASSVQSSRYCTSQYCTSQMYTLTAATR